MATYARPTVFWLPNPFPDPPSQGLVIPGRNDVVYSIFNRGRKTIVRPRRLGPAPTKPSKYNTLPSKIELREDALPTDTPKHLREVAKGLFNASITDKSARAYDSTVRKIECLEALIGRKISLPLSNGDYNLVLTYLVDRGGRGGKGLSYKAIKKHLSGIRRMSLAEGVACPEETPDLTNTLLKGH